MEFSEDSHFFRRNRPSGDILIEEDWSARSGLVRSWQFGGRWQAVASGGRVAHDLTPLVPAVGGVEREAWDGRTVARERWGPPNVDNGLTVDLEIGVWTPATPMRFAKPSSRMVMTAWFCGGRTSITETTSSISSSSSGPTRSGSSSIETETHARSGLGTITPLCIMAGMPEMPALPRHTLCRVSGSNPLADRRRPGGPHGPPSRRSRNPLRTAPRRTAGESSFLRLFPLPPLSDRILALGAEGANHVSRVPESRWPHPLRFSQVRTVVS